MTPPNSNSRQNQDWNPGGLIPDSELESTVRPLLSKRKKLIKSSLRGQATNNVRIVLYKINYIFLYENTLKYFIKHIFLF